jgi:hypothetical protein
MDLSIPQMFPVFDATASQYLHHVGTSQCPGRAVSPPCKADIRTMKIIRDSMQISQEEMHQKRVDELDKAEVSLKADYRLLFDTLSHCAEPADAEAILSKIEGDASTSLAQKERETSEQEHAEGRYRVNFKGRSYPERHHTWPEDFLLHVDDKEEFYYVLRSEKAQPEDDDQMYPTMVAPDDSKTRIGEFGLRHECDSRARDKDNNLIGKANNQIEFNYAEHKMIGEMLHLRWSKTETRLGTTELQLPNDVKLTYGQINGLGGDFFGGYNPVSNGKTLEEQCKFFQEAFNTLADSNGAKKKVEQLLIGRKDEVDAIAKAVDGGLSTFEAYKGLNKPAFFGLSQDDVNDQINTASGAGLSYLRLAQVNFDHFGQDAVTAYNAGHYCALKTAAGGNLELAYAMNAFADHYLGDCFASGHFRTPRRALHGSTKAFGAAWDAFSGGIQTALVGGGFTSGLMKVMAPDLLSMVSMIELISLVAYVLTQYSANA